MPVARLPGPSISKVTCLEVQTLLLDLGVDDVDIAQLRNEQGEDIGFDLRITIDPFPSGHNGFLDRLTMSVTGATRKQDHVVPIVHFHWVLSNETTIAGADECEKLLTSQPVATIKRILHRRELARIARRAYDNMNSTSDSPQAKA